MKTRNRILELFQKLGIMRFVDYPAALSLMGSSLAPNWGAVLASATQITITSAIHKVTGTTSVTTVKIPTGFRGAFVLVPTGAVPLTSGGTYVASDGTNEVIPFALTQTCVANRIALCVTDGLLIYTFLSA